jgi:drug/metabolite transporter (DMT)-like permease
MQGQNHASLISSIVLCVGIAAVSTASIFVRYAQADAPSLVIATYRLAIASIVLLPVASLRYPIQIRRLRAEEWKLAFASGVFLAIHFAAWIASLEYTSVASSVVLVSTSPLWVAITAWLLLGERLTRPAIIGLITAFAGSLIITFSDAAQPTGTAPLFGNMLALIGALAVAGYWLIGRRLRSNLSLVPYVTIVYSAAALLLFATAIAASQPLIGYSPTIYVWFLLLALVPQLVGHSSFNWTLARLPATFVAVATLGEPIGASVLAFLLLGETPAMLKIAGAALVLAGIAVTMLSQKTIRSIENAELL